MKETAVSNDRPRGLAKLVFPLFGLAVITLFAWFLYEVANGALDF
jgi:hypothetical protein